MREKYVRDHELDRLCYDIHEVARAWKSSPTMVRREIKAGHLKAFRVGNLLRVTHEALLEYAQRNPFDGPKVARNPWGKRGKPAEAAKVQA